MCSLDCFGPIRGVGGRSSAVLGAWHPVAHLIITTPLIHCATGNGEAMFFGDGSRDPKAPWGAHTATNSPCGKFPPLVSLDITAHELAHGVTEHNNQLFYQVCRLCGCSCLGRIACDCKGVGLAHWRIRSGNSQGVTLQRITHPSKLQPPPTNQPHAHPSHSLLQFSFGGINEALSGACGVRGGLRVMV